MADMAGPLEATIAEAEKLGHEAVLAEGLTRLGVLSSWLGDNRGRPTNGVCPTDSASEAYRTMDEADQPPATAGSTTTTSPSVVAALSPPLKRTSSSLT